MRNIDISGLKNESPFLKVPEAAVMFRLHPMSIYRLCKAGKIPHIRVGKSIRISKDAFDKMMEKGILV